MTLIDCKKVKVLHLLADGGTGGIELLCKNFYPFSENENIFLFPWRTGGTTNSMKQGGAKVLEYNHSRKVYLFTVFKILKLCRRERIDLVVAHHGITILRGIPILLKLLKPGLRAVIYVHSDPTIEDNSRVRFCIKTVFQKFFYRKADKIIAISDFVKKKLIQHYQLEPEKIVRIYNAAPLEQYCNCIREPGELVQMVFHGRLVEVKGVQVILHALSLLPSQLGYHFTIIGDGDYRAELEKLCGEYKLMDRVTFLGNRTDISALLAKKDVFINMPVWEEGFGISVVEAMASGLLCIVAESGALPELIHHGKNGFVVKSGNYTALAQVIGDVIDSLGSSSYTQMREQALADSAGYDIQSYAEVLDHELCALLDNET